MLAVFSETDLSTCMYGYTYTTESVFVCDITDVFKTRLVVLHAGA